MAKPITIDLDASLRDQILHIKQRVETLRAESAALKKKIEIQICGKQKPGAPLLINEFQIQALMLKYNIDKYYDMSLDKETGHYTPSKTARYTLDDIKLIKNSNFVKRNLMGFITALVIPTGFAGGVALGTLGTLGAATLLAVGTLVPLILIPLVATAIIIGLIAIWDHFVNKEKLAELNVAEGIINVLEEATKPQPRATASTHQTIQALASQPRSISALDSEVAATEKEDESERAAKAKQEANAAASRIKELEELEGEAADTQRVLEARFGFFVTAPSEDLFATAPLATSSVVRAAAPGSSSNNA